MGNQRSVGRFCSLIATNLTGTSDSIAAFNGALLGEGAEAFCTSNGHVYRFTSSLGVVIPSVYIAANVGGGTWVVQDGDGFFTGAAESTVNYEGSSVTPVASTWAALASGVNFYGGTGQSGLWTTNTSSGVITYSSAVPANNMPFLFTGQVTLYSATANQQLELALSPSAGNPGCLIGTTTNRAGSIVVQQNLPSTAGNPLNFSISTIFAAQPGIGYQWVFRNFTGPNAVQSLYYGLNLAPLGRS